MTYDENTKITIFHLRNQGSDHMCDVILGEHVSAEELIERYPYFTGWEYAKDRFESPRDMLDAIGGVEELTHTTLGDL
jgi:hypothetical protein